MRIIAGIAKGRRLVGPRRAGTRPMMDRVREALFSSLGDAVVGARTLDLYAGSGSLGLEALSRGAASAVFVESHREALRALRANVERVGLGGEIVADDVAAFVGRSHDEFDLVFVDPPYDLPLASVEHLLGRLVDLTAAGGVVVLHRRSGTGDPEIPPGMAPAGRRRYGTADIVRLAKE